MMNISIESFELLQNKIIYFIIIRKDAFLSIEASNEGDGEVRIFNFIFVTLTQKTLVY